MRAHLSHDFFNAKWDLSSIAAEIDEIYAWNDTTPEDHTKAEILAEINEVYHRYGRYPTQCGYWTP